MVEEVYTGHIDRELNKSSTVIGHPENNRRLRALHLRRSYGYHAAYRVPDSQCHEHGGSHQQPRAFAR